LKITFIGGFGYPEPFSFGKDVKPSWFQKKKNNLVPKLVLKMVAYSHFLTVSQ
jgi:hypothetical protein